MKNIKLSTIYIAFIILAIFISCNSTSKSKNKIRKPDSQTSDSSYLDHFRIMDSAANATMYDTIVLCCRESISFMEKTTKIPANSSGSLFGKMYFTKSDLRRWHEWYKKFK